MDPLFYPHSKDPENDELPDSDDSVRDKGFPYFENTEEEAEDISHFQDCYEAEDDLGTDLYEEIKDGISEIKHRNIRDPFSNKEDGDMETIDVGDTHKLLSLVSVFGIRPSCFQTTAEMIHDVTGDPINEIRTRLLEITSLAPYEIRLPSEKDAYDLYYRIRKLGGWATISSEN